MIVMALCYISRRVGEVLSMEDVFDDVEAPSMQNEAADDGDDSIRATVSSSTVLPASTGDTRQD